jgi:hypothetical protein
MLQLALLSLVGAIVGAIVGACATGRPSCGSDLKVGASGVVSLRSAERGTAIQAEFAGRQWTAAAPTRPLVTDGGQAEIIDGKPYRELRVQTPDGRTIDLAVVPVGCA